MWLKNTLGAFSILLFLLCLMTSLHVCGQGSELYNEAHDERPYYFGLTVGYNSSSLDVVRHNNFANNAYFRRIEPHASGGIELGLMATLPLPADHWELRTVPKLVIGGSKYLSYYYKDGSPLYNINSDIAIDDNTGIPSRIENVKLPATIFSFPLHIKFSSDRIHNFRVYVFGGPKYDINLSANAAEYKNAILGGMYPPPNFRKNSLGGEAGIGFHFYMPFAVISPEIRFAYSLQNDLGISGNNPYANALSRLQTRMVSFSINIEQ